MSNSKVSSLYAAMLAFALSEPKLPSLDLNLGGSGGLSSNWDGARSSNDYIFEKKGARRKTPKCGRNDLCLCGSGLKYKKCCG